MAGIQASNGLITGIPIQDTIDKLLEIAAVPRKKLEARIEDIKTQKLAIAEMTALVIGVQLSATRLSKSSLFQQTTVAAGDDKVLAASTTGNPAVGTYEYTAVRRAQSHQLLSQGLASKSTPLGAGTMAIQFGGFVDKGFRLDELNAGNGVQHGKIRITDRSGASATIDLRYATTIDDVLTAINESTGIQVRAETSGDRIRLIDESGGTTSNLRVQEVGSTSTAADLGLDGINVAASSADGDDILGMYSGMSLSRLNDGNGVRLRRGAAEMRATLSDGSTVDLDFFAQKKGETTSTGTTNAKSGLNGQIKITSTGVGSSVDGYKLVFQDDSTITAGNEKVSFNAANKTFTVKIDAGNTRAAEVIAKLNADTTFSGTFTASNGVGGNGTAVVDVADTLTTSGGAVEYYNESTVGDLLDTINRAAPTRLQARISASGDSLELVDLTGGAGSFTVSSLYGGSAAEDLGWNTVGSGGVIGGERRVAGLKTVLLDSLAGGFGLGDLGVLSLTNRAGSSASVDLSAAKTLEDVLQSINAAGINIQAEVNSSRNGLTLTDTSGGAGNLIIANGDATNTADKLKIATNAATSTARGSSLALQTVSESQLLSSLRNGRGIGTGSFLITNTNGQVGAVNLGVLQARTVGDVIDGINGLSLGITARINDTGDGIVLLDTAGGTGQITVADVGAGTAARDLKLAGTSTLQTINGTPTKAIDGSYSVRVTLDSDDTLQDLVTKINAANGNVAATLINTGGGATPFRLSLASQISGAAGEMLVDASAFNIGFQQSSAAQDALLLLGSPEAAIPGALISSANNEFTDVLEGVKLTVNSASTTPQTITIDKKADTIISQLKLFVDQYNKVRDKITETASFDAEASTTGVLFGSTDILLIEMEFSSTMTSRYFTTGAIQSWEDVGISPDAQGKLQFNEDKFRAKYAADPSSVEQFFTKSGTGGAAQVIAAAERLSGAKNSTLINRTTAMQRTIDNNQAQINKMNTTLERERERMVKQFAKLEESIARMQANLTSISKIQAISWNTSSSSK